MYNETPQNILALPGLWPLVAKPQSGTAIKAVMSFLKSSAKAATMRVSARKRSEYLLSIRYSGMKLSHVTNGRFKSVVVAISQQ